MWWLISLAVVVGLGAAWHLLRLTRLRSERARKFSTGSAIRLGIGAQLAESERPLVRPHFNPLEGLAFEDALDAQKLAIHMHSATERALAESVSRSGFQLGNLSLQVLSTSHQGFLVTFEHGTAEFVRTAEGIYKAQTRAPSGAFKEIGNLDQIGTWANRAANAAAITVAVANLISNADSSKKLGKLISGQERHFAYRSIDQYAAIKAAYEELREELALESPDLKAVGKIRHRIREVRHRLMLEAKHDLKNLPLLYPEKRGWLIPGTRKKTRDWYARTLKGVERERAIELDAFRGKLLLARHCVTFENIAATAVDLRDHQDKLIKEAGLELAQMLPRYQELEAELGQSPDARHLLASLFSSAEDEEEQS